VTVCCVATGRGDPGALAGALGVAVAPGSGEVRAQATVGGLVSHLPDATILHWLLFSRGKVGRRVNGTLSRVDL